MGGGHQGVLLNIGLVWLGGRLGPCGPDQSLEEDLGLVLSP